MAKLLLKLPLSLQHVSNKSKPLYPCLPNYLPNHDKQELFTLTTLLRDQMRIYMHSLNNVTKSSHFYDNSLQMLLNINENYKNLFDSSHVIILYALQYFYSQG